MAKFHVRRDKQGNGYEVGTHVGSNWLLVLQYGRYVFEDGEFQEGYRFMYPRPRRQTAPFPCWGKDPLSPYGT